MKEVTRLKTELYSTKSSTEAIHFHNQYLFIALFVLFLIQFHLFMIRKRKNESSTQLEKMKSEFYMNITHEFRTPITIIRGLSEKLRNTIKEDQKIKNIIDLEIISRQSENLLFLVNEILSVSKIKSQQKVLWINDNVVDYLKHLHHLFASGTI